MKNLFKYRPEIDGLRAIAILPVIFYHAGFHFFSGGYVGVDIFFVISGYLISSIILSEIETGKFSLLNFYQRRARRILPALFCVILISIPFAWFILLPADLELFGNSAFSALTFWSNYIFYFEIDYFETSSKLKPLLHTWSLSIEEQFYIIYPLLLIFFFKFGKKTFITFLIVSGIFSLILSQWAGNLKFTYPYFEKELLFFNQSSLTNFFLPIGRIWELIIGILIAFYIKKNGQPNKFNEVLTLIGLLLIIYSVFTFTPETNYPSFNTLIPTIGTGLLILYMNSKTVTYKIFSQKSLVFIGLISYSAYLYHYPIFTFIEYSNHLNANLILKIILIFFTFFISFISWRYIEKPFRNKKIISKKHFFYTLLTLYLLVSFLVVLNFYSKGFKSRFDKDFKNFSINFNVKELEKETSEYKNNLRLDNQFDTNNKKKILIIGNSVAIDLLMSFEQNKDLFTYYEFKEYYFKPENLLKNSYKDQLEINKLINNKLFINADVLMISSLYNEYETSFSNNNIINLLDKFAKKHNKLLVITGNNPVFYDDSGISPVLSMLLKNRNNNFSEKELKKLYYKRLSNKFLNIAKKVKTISTNLDIIFLDKYDYSCSLDEKICSFLTDEKKLIYFDGIHYTKKGAKYFGKIMHEISWLKPLDNHFKNK
ncbi:acyltransferase [Candidatus Pelagibacter sp.]|nr:acyltransferase [Candidatus Pelagibacter sp.]